MLPATTAPGEAVAAEISTRLDAMWSGWDACRTAPTACDINTLIVKYSSPDSPAASLMRNGYDYLISKGVHSIHVDKIERSIASLDVSGETATSDVCVRDGSTTVDASGNVVDSGVGLTLYHWEWSKNDDQWIVVGGENYRVQAGSGNPVCDAYSQ